jgi:hypothetical protein
MPAAVSTRPPLDARSVAPPALDYYADEFAEMAKLAQYIGKARLVQHAAVAAIHREIGGSVKLVEVVYAHERQASYTF